MLVNNSFECESNDIETYKVSSARTKIKQDVKIFYGSKMQMQEAGKLPQYNIPPVKYL